MILIAHRGNHSGVNKERENTLSYLFEAIDLGYDVEVDIWYVDDGFFLGHDGPQHHVTLDDIFKIGENGWFHAKNYAALSLLLSFDLHVFFHDQDEYTLTSRGLIWAYSGKYVNDFGIACMPESTPGFAVPENAFGVCSDNLELFK